MERVGLFKSDFFVTKIGNESELIDLKEQMHQAHVDDVESINMSNAGCWRSTVQYSNINWLLDGVKIATEQAINYYTGFDSTFKKHIKEKHISLDYWSNINEPGSRNVLHNHVADSFAAVYYVQGKDTGALKFINPGNVLNDCNPISPYTREVLVYPTDGELILWPAWVPHEVETNTSNRQRMNIAFTIQVR